GQWRGVCGSRGSGGQWQLRPAHARTQRPGHTRIQRRIIARSIDLGLLSILVVCSPPWVQPQSAGGDITLLSFNDTDGGQEMSIKLQILVLMTLLGFLPAMLMLMTCFTRFIIVLSILRQAIGLQQSPPNNVLIGIALCLTLLVMRPVWM